MAESSALIIQSKGVAMYNAPGSSPLSPAWAKRQSYLWSFALWDADHRVCGCSEYTSLPCLVQSYRSSVKKNTSMDRSSTVWPENSCFLLCRSSRSGTTRMDAFLHMNIFLTIKGGGPAIILLMQHCVKHYLAITG